MKKQTLLAVLALAFAGAMAPSATATLPAANGDLYLGFYATSGTGSTESLLINIGQASDYRDFTGSFFKLELGDVEADLVDVFGASWNSRSDVKWGVFGTTYDSAVGSDPAWTIYGGRAQTTLGTQATAYNRGSTATQSQPATRLHDLADHYAEGTATANSSVATIQLTTEDNDFAQYQTTSGATSFSYFQNALADFTTGTTVYNGAFGSRVDLFRMQTGSSSLKGTYEGTFAISDIDGSTAVYFGSTATFTPVPEPSVYGFAIAGAAVVLVVLRRRKAAINA
jgi:hypothetical protein